ncbi:MAG: helix-turn-helix domain-containing protein [Victivallales bacterium]|nr:helix-turn-helix domain-containing protein [Victivallales bacterium]
MLEQFKETGILTEEIRVALRNTRKAFGLSRNALAEIFGVEMVTVSRWERGPTAKVHQSQRDMIVDLLEGKLDGMIARRIKPHDTALKPELSETVAQICDIYSLCKTQEERESFFHSLDELQKTIEQALAKTMR